MPQQTNYTTDWNQFDDQTISPLNFTAYGEEQIYSVVDQEAFLDQDADLIYQSLKTKLRLVPFSDYLKRYIYRYAGFSGNYNEIELAKYQETIREWFNENDTPASLADKPAKINALARNWLTQPMVSRQTVFLLGFGLHMPVEEVSHFLQNALREQGFDFKDPMEIIYWYCFRNRLPFAKMQQLKRRYDEMPLVGDSAVYGEDTMAVHQRAVNIRDDDSLMKYLRQFKADRPKGPHSKTTRRWFDDLYQQCRSIIAEQKNTFEEEKLEKAIEAYRTEMKHSTKFTEEEKHMHVDCMRREIKRWTAEEISGGEIEVYLCTITLPADQEARNLPLDDTARSLGVKRFTRQHVFDLLKNRTPINRYDLLTLLFFVHAHKEGLNRKQLIFDFWEQADEMLLACSMSKLYTANPYECFLLMCMVSEGPMATFADVWQKMIEE